VFSRSATVSATPLIRPWTTLFLRSASPLASLSNPERPRSVHARAIPRLFTLLRTLLHRVKSYPAFFQQVPHSLRKTPGVGGIAAAPSRCQLSSPTHFPLFPQLVNTNLPFVICNLLQPSSFHALPHVFRHPRIGGGRGSKSPRTCNPARRQGAESPITSHQSPHCSLLTVHYSLPSATLFPAPSSHSTRSHSLLTHAHD
jgi:hypothetical protein